MQSSLVSARRHQIIFVILLTVCLAQVGWWMMDQWLFSGEVQESLQETHQRSVDAAKVMVEQGVATNDVAEMFPALSVSCLLYTSDAADE